MVDDFKRHLEAQHVGKLCSHLVHGFITKPFRDSELHVATSPPHLPPPWAHMEKKGSLGSVPTPTCPPAAALQQEGWEHEEKHQHALQKLRQCPGAEQLRGSPLIQGQRGKKQPTRT